MMRFGVIASNYHGSTRKYYLLVHLVHVIGYMYILPYLYNPSLDSILQPSTVLDTFPSARIAEEANLDTIRRRHHNLGLDQIISNTPVFLQPIKSLNDSHRRISDLRQSKLLLRAISDQLHTTTFPKERMTYANTYPGSAVEGKILPRSRRPRLPSLRTEIQHRWR